MSFLKVLNISGSALTAQRKRVDIITQNLANIQTTRTAEGGPYIRKLTILKEQPLSFKKILNNRLSEGSRGGVIVDEVIESAAPLIPVYDPQHPDANAEGYVMMPNVNRTEEQIDLMSATRAYEANLTALNVVKAMIIKTLDIGK